MAPRGRVVRFGRLMATVMFAGCCAAMVVAGPGPDLVFRVSAIVGLATGTLMGSGIGILLSEKPPRLIMPILFSVPVAAGAVSRMFWSEVPATAAAITSLASAALVLFLCCADDERLLPHHCSHCGYSLRGIGGEACPECGRVQVDGQGVGSNGSTDATETPPPGCPDRPHSNTKPVSTQALILQGLTENSSAVARHREVNADPGASSSSRNLSKSP